jgi:hypothetical protein
MLKADTTTSTPEPEFARPFQTVDDLNAPLHDLRSALGIIRHLALGNSHSEVSRDEWIAAICLAERWADDLRKTLGHRPR